MSEPDLTAAQAAAAELSCLDASREARQDAVLWRFFQDWCVVNGLVAAPDDSILTAWLWSQREHWGWCAMRAAALRVARVWTAQHHPDPRGGQVRDLLMAVARQQGRRQEPRTAPLRPADSAAMAALPAESSASAVRNQVALRLLEHVPLAAQALLELPVSLPSDGPLQLRFLEDAEPPVTIPAGSPARQIAALLTELRCARPEGVAVVENVAGTLPSRQAAIASVERAFTRAGNLAGLEPGWWRAVQDGTPLPLETLALLAVLLVPGSIARLRDEAYTSLGIYGCRRHAELRRLRWGHLTLEADGVLLRVPRAKSTLHGAGPLPQVFLQTLPSPGCPVAALLRLRTVLSALGLAGDNDPVLPSVHAGGVRGPLSAGTSTMNKRLQRAAARTGLSSSTFTSQQPHITTRSLRVGGITAAGEAGIELSRIADTSLHASLEQLLVYLRFEDPIRHAHHLLEAAAPPDPPATDPSPG